MPAGIDAEESGDIGKAYGAAGVRAMLPTRLDLTRPPRRYSIRRASRQSDFFGRARTRRKWRTGLFAMTPKRLAALMMPPARVNETSTIIRKKQVNAGQ